VRPSFSENGQRELNFTYSNQTLFVPKRHNKFALKAFTLIYETKI
jgi:hypothetical protein